MKLLKIAAWVSGIFATLMVLTGSIALVLQTNLLGVRREVNFFHVADSFYLLAIVCILAHQGCRKNKE